MSWDISIQRFSQNYSSVEEIPEDEECLPIGAHSDVQSAISAHFPDTNWSDPNWGLFDCPFGSIEFNLGESDPLVGFMLHVRASAEVVPSIIALCKQHKWQALDCGSGEFLEHSDNPVSGLSAWSDFRDKVVGGA